MKHDDTLLYMTSLNIQVKENWSLSTKISLCSENSFYWTACRAVLKLFIVPPVPHAHNMRFPAMNDGTYLENDIGTPKTATALILEVTLSSIGSLDYDESNAVRCGGGYDISGFLLANSHLAGYNRAFRNFLA